jgi:hypothetical protein
VNTCEGCCWHVVRPRYVHIEDQPSVAFIDHHCYRLSGKPALRRQGGFMPAEFYRCRCGYTHRIVRPPRSGRKMGHRKKLFCGLCGRYRVFVRVG